MDASGKYVEGTGKSQRWDYLEKQINAYIY